MSDITHIMVIEDDPVICWDLKLQFRFIDEAKIVFFEKMADASEFLKANHPDLIITNLRLWDGWVNQNFLQQLEAVSCPLVILTGMRDKRFQPKFSNRGPTSFLYKPFTQLQLKKMVESFI